MENWQKILDIDHILNHVMVGKKPYVFFDNHPIDNRRPKYARWRRLYQEGNLKCKCCKSEPVMKLVKCKTMGNIHKPTGLTKYSFKMFSKSDGSEMTFDHWIPKSFLKKKRLDSKVPSNLVLMCRKCNALKADLVPLNWHIQYAIGEAKY